MMTENGRYSGKPFLRLLECYILRIIGHLSAADQENLTLLEPKLQETFKSGGSWYEIVASQLNLSSEDTEKIKQLWETNAKSAGQKGAVLTPQHFSAMIADQLIRGE